MDFPAGLRNIRSVLDGGKRVGCLLHGVVDAGTMTVHGSKPFPICPQCMETGAEEIGEGIVVVDPPTEDETPDEDEGTLVQIAIPLDAGDDYSCEFCDTAASRNCGGCGKPLCDEHSFGSFCPDCKPTHTYDGGHHMRIDPTEEAFNRGSLVQRMMNMRPSILDRTGEE